MFFEKFLILKSLRYGICVDGDGDILVSEAEHGQILMFKKDGSGPVVVADEGLSRPMGIGITPEGYLAVADRYNHCIRLYQYKRDVNDCHDCFEMNGTCPKVVFVTLKSYFKTFLSAATIST